MQDVIKIFTSYFNELTWIWRYLWIPRSSLCCRWTFVLQIFTNSRIRFNSVVSTFGSLKWWLNHYRRNTCALILIIWIRSQEYILILCRAVVVPPFCKWTFTRSRLRTIHLLTLSANSELFNILDGHTWYFIFLLFKGENLSVWEYNMNVYKEFILSILIFCKTQRRLTSKIFSSSGIIILKY